MVARKLLGCYLAHIEEKQTTVGRIVETEAYLSDDPAAHGFVGKTKRNAVLFGPVGHAYVYFIYGMHFCFNVASGKEGSGEGVLVRALEPLEGIAVMERRRGTRDLINLCNGPGKLAQALGITRALDGVPVFDDKSPLQIWSADTFAAASPIRPAQIARTTRIGVAKAQELELRFHLKGNRFVSR